MRVRVGGGRRLPGHQHNQGQPQGQLCTGPAASPGCRGAGRLYPIPQGSKAQGREKQRASPAAQKDIGGGGAGSAGARQDRWTRARAVQRAGARRGNEMRGRGGLPGRNRAQQSKGAAACPRTVNVARRLRPRPAPAAYDTSAVPAVKPGCS